MLAKIQKWGNSLGVRLPKQLAKAIDLNAGSFVTITSSDNSLIIKLKDDHLDTLLDQITDQNLHSVIFDEDDKKGNEVW